MTELTFLRHGRSQADDDGVFEGRLDSPLTKVGMRQAEKLCEVWRSESRPMYDVVVSSPLSRAVATAGVFARHYELPVQTEESLLEMDGGKLVGMKRNEANELYPRPEFCTPFFRNGLGTGESLVQLHARALQAIDSLLEMGKSRYLVVAHGGILNAILRAAFGIPLPINESGGFFGLGDLGYADVVYDQSRYRWILKSLFGGIGVDA